jgi:membrane protease YdiL (CAAX protease family)
MFGLNYNPLLIIFFLPSLITLVAMRRQHHSWKCIQAFLGWQSSGWPAYVWGVALAAGFGSLTIAAFLLIDPDVLRHPPQGTDQYAYSLLGLNAGTLVLAFFWEAIFNTLGEEVFFRGLLGAWLVARFGFRAGNIVQATCFLIPHLVLLLVSPRLWPVLVSQFIGGWALGLLRHRSGSILPGWLSHTVINTLADAIAMLH